jgi:hypothetical protein
VGQGFSKTVLRIQTKRLVPFCRQASRTGPDLAPALGLRAGIDGFFIISQTRSRKEKNHVVLFLDAKPETIQTR